MTQEFDLYAAINAVDEIYSQVKEKVWAINIAAFRRILDKWIDPRLQERLDITFDRASRIESVRAIMRFNGKVIEISQNPRKKPTEWRIDSPGFPTISCEGYQMQNSLLFQLGALIDPDLDVSTQSDDEETEEDEDDEY
jgi:hypothetical protein